MRRLGVGLLALRATGVAALLLLLWNPGIRAPADAARPLVLLDASLSLAGHGGRWSAALDTARALARGGVIWRFGARVAAFDTAPPTDGASRLAPALAPAAARGGPVVVVTDGEVADFTDLPADLSRLPMIVALSRPPFADNYVAGVEGTRRVGAKDTIELRVTVGKAGKRETGRKGGARIEIRLAGRALLTRAVALPDSGTIAIDLSLPAARLPAGWQALEVALAGAADAEPRDDARLFLVDVSPEPAAVILAAPPDWESRFLARTLGDVARVPVKVFVQPERSGGWRDGASLAPVAAGTVARAVAGARLVVLAGEPERFRALQPAGNVLAWPAAPGTPGDWYAVPVPASPLGGALAGLAWDSLPPVSAAQPVTPDSGAVVALAASLGRRGAARPIVLLRERGGRRTATVTASGLWRWAFRGGASAEAYRALVAGLADWLIGERGAGSRERAVPVTLEVANGLPLRWRWSAAGEPRDLAVRLENGAAVRNDTLRFDATGRAELRLPPGVYRYALADGPERGLVAVETYSDEWRPAAVAVRAQPGVAAARGGRVGLRDRWWLFALAMLAFTAEWAWRRRQGLP
ncbi:MAG TPA: hypothetical protein VNH63_02075 [Gemmatimonadales bacterium]|nr:hypothetical protein [Gemmatimonadales bacterium]